MGKIINLDIERLKRQCEEVESLETRLKNLVKELDIDSAYPSSYYDASLTDSFMYFEKYTPESFEIDDVIQTLLSMQYSLDLLGYKKSSDKLGDLIGEIMHTEKV